MDRYDIFGSESFITYRQFGNYTATFVGSSATVYGGSEDHKQIQLTITP